MRPLTMRMLPVGSWRSTKRWSTWKKTRSMRPLSSSQATLYGARLLPRGAALCLRTRTSSVAMVPGTASAMVGVARRSMTPVGVCQSRSITRGSATPGGSRRAFFSRISMRGPMPARLLAAAKRGVSCSGRMDREGGQTPRLIVAFLLQDLSRGV